MQKKLVTTSGVCALEERKIKQLTKQKQKKLNER